MAAQNFPNQTVGLVSRGQRPLSGLFAVMPKVLAGLKQAGVFLIDFDEDASAFVQTAMPAVATVNKAVLKLGRAVTDFGRLAKTMPTAAIGKVAAATTPQFGAPFEDRNASVRQSAAEQEAAYIEVFVKQVEAVRNPELAKIAEEFQGRRSSMNLALDDLRATKEMPDTPLLTKDERDLLPESRIEWSTKTQSELYDAYSNLATRINRAREAGDTARVDALLREDLLFRAATRPLIHAMIFPAGWRPGMGRNELGATGAAQARELLAAFKLRRTAEAKPTITCAAEMAARIETAASLVFGTDVSFRGPGGLSAAGFQKIMNSKSPADFTQYDPGSVRRAIFRDDQIALGPWTSSVFARLNGGAK